MNIFDSDCSMASLINKKNKMDGLLLLSRINDGIISTAFFDPQYRGVLDKLKYGNEGQDRGKARCSLVQMNESTIIDFIFLPNNAKLSGFYKGN